MGVCRIQPVPGPGNDQAQRGRKAESEPGPNLELLPQVEGRGGVRCGGSCAGDTVKDR